MRIPARLKMESEGGVPGVGDATTRQPAPVPAASYSPVASQEPQPIRVLPIVTSVARSQVARGLRRLASLVEPSDRLTPEFGARRHTRGVFP